MLTGEMGRRRMIVVVPAWGDDYCRLFLGPVLRTHRAALEALRQEFANTVEVRYVVQTDQPVAVARALEGIDLTLVPTPATKRFVFQTLCEGHARGIEDARELDRVVLLNADIMISTGTFAAIERRFRQGKKAVVCGGTRTLVRPWTMFPKPLPARALASWAIRHPHPITRDFFWGTGKTTHPCTVYFREGANVVLRGFHLHPLAIIKDRRTPFDGSIDLNLIEAYRTDEIHLVTDVDELSIAEISAKGKTYDTGERPFDVSQIVSWAVRGATSMHWWNFSHRIIIAGSGDAVAGDMAIADEVLRLNPYPAALAPTTI